MRSNRPTRYPVPPAEPNRLVLPSTLHRPNAIDVNPDLRAEPPLGVSSHHGQKRYRHYRTKPGMQALTRRVSFRHAAADRNACITSNTGLIVGD
jgi:hypothetical protein